MPAVPLIIAGAAVVGAGAAVVGTIKGAEAASKQYKAQNQQFQYERQLQNNRAAKERKDAIRAGRLAGASLAQQAENTGGSTSSAALGSLGSIQSQIASNISFLDTNQKLSNDASNQAGIAAKYGRQRDFWGSVGSLGATVFEAAGGVNAIRKGF